MRTYILKVILVACHAYVPFEGYSSNVPDEALLQ